MRGRLLAQAMVKFLLGAGLTILLLFPSAGTLSYWQGWLFLGILFVPMFLAGLVLLWKNPRLLASRLRARERESEQRTVLLFSGLMFVGGFVLCGLNVRFTWLVLPDWVSLAASAVFLLAYGLYGEVLRENTFLSRTIEVQKGQTVVDTGLYGIVRHPMYAVTVLLFLSMPLVLGSVQAFGLFLLYPLLLVKRIENEEQVLSRELPGYTAYMQKVRYRLIPFIW